MDVPRFMGDWYVHGHTPLFMEKNASNAVESYHMNDNGEILTVYTYRNGGSDGAIKMMKPKGFVESESGAEWSMRFIWPFKAQYLIGHVNDDYTETIVGRSKRDYVWIMTRSPEIEQAAYEALLRRVGDLGYDPADVRRVPQSWPDPGHPVTSAPKSLALKVRGHEG